MPRTKPIYTWPIVVGEEPLEAEKKAKHRVTYKQGKRFHTEKAPTGIEQSNAQMMRENGLYANGKKIKTQATAKPKQTAEQTMVLLGEALRKAGL